MKTLLVKPVLRVHRIVSRLGPVRLVPVLLGIACSSPDFTGPVSVDPTQLAWTLSLNAHAITMSTTAPYDTLQLTAVPRTVTGALLSEAPPVTFTTSDSSLRVSATGLLTALRARNGVRLVATTVYRGIRISDTAMVNITASVNPPQFRHLLLQPAPGSDTTIQPGHSVNEIYAPVTSTVQIEAQDSTGARIPSSLVALEVSDEWQGVFNPDFSFGGERRLTTGATTVLVGAGRNGYPGVPFTVYATATVYGVTLQDSLRFVVTDPIMAGFTLFKTVAPGTTTPVYTLQPTYQQFIAVGGWVWWMNSTTAADSMDIVFDDPTAATADFVFLNSGEGNIPAFPGDPNFLGAADPSLFIQSRQFLRAGTFHFHSPRTGLSGTIIVR